MFRDDKVAAIEKDSAEFKTKYEDELKKRLKLEAELKDIKGKYSSWMGLAANTVKRVKALGRLIFHFCFGLVRFLVIEPTLWFLGLFGAILGEWALPVFAIFVIIAGALIAESTEAAPMIHGRPHSTVVLREPPP